MLQRGATRGTALTRVLVPAAPPDIALQYISYPYFALAKTCKVIPVMLANMVLNQRRYSAQEYISLIVVTAGVCSRTPTPTPTLPAMLHS